MYLTFYIKIFFQFNNVTDFLIFYLVVFGENLSERIEYVFRKFKLNLVDKE